jgi:hypothetical protein
VATSQSTDIDVDSLILELAASLVPPQRAAFEVAARAALVAVNCSGVGAAYRVLAPLQRGFWDPPPDTRAIAGPHHRGGKLVSGPPIGSDDPRVGGRDRHRLRAAVE